MTSQYFITY